MIDEMAVFDEPDETPAVPVAQPVDPEIRELQEDVSGHADADDFDRNAAEYLLKKEFLIRKDLAKAVAFIDAEIAEAQGTLARLEARREEIAKPFQKRLDWLAQRFDDAITAWARAALAFARTKTIKLAYGSISFRKQKDQIAVSDTPAATQWARVHAPELLTFTDQTAAAKLVNELAPDLLVIDDGLVGRYVTESGDIPAGVTVTAVEDKPYIKTTEIRQ
ncbi:MAG TPA: host-nuclease inhibitor Gam family protein [Armatimonadota bacterium]|jgi:phage host-nuclease inhibitor protein Gam